MNIDINFEKRGRNAHKYRELMKAINSVNNSLENKSNITLNSPRNKYSYPSQNTTFSTSYISPSNTMNSTTNYISLKKKKKPEILGLKPDFLSKTKKDTKTIGVVKKNQFGITNYLNNELEKFDGMLKRGKIVVRKPKKDNFWEVNSKKERETQEEYRRELKEKSKIALEKLKHWDNEFVI